MPFDHEMQGRPRPKSVMARVPLWELAGGANVNYDNPHGTIRGMKETGMTRLDLYVGHGQLISDRSPARVEQIEGWARVARQEGLLVSVWAYIVGVLDVGPLLDWRDRLSAVGVTMNIEIQAKYDQGGRYEMMEECCAELADRFDGPKQVTSYGDSPLSIDFNALLRQGRNIHLAPQAYWDEFDWMTPDWSVDKAVKDYGFDPVQVHPWIGGSRIRFHTRQEYHTNFARGLRHGWSYYRPEIIQDWRTWAG